MTTAESDEPIPVAVVGAGGMGSHHVRVYEELPEADLVEVIEPDPKRALEIRLEYDIPVHDDVTDLSDARAASVAVPNEGHRETAEACLAAGMDILVEKPLAPTPEDARAIIDAAADHDAVLQVGHIERFNPAVMMLETILEERTIVEITAKRLGPFNDHLADENVVFDLMIHDIDIVTTLVPSEIESFNVLGVTIKSGYYDHAVVQLRFENGTIGTLTASHVTSAKVRTLDVVTDGPYINLEYQEQELQLQQRVISRSTEVLETTGYETKTITETPYVGTREPLKNELEHFLGCVRSRETPMVDGEDGYEAVALSTEITDALDHQCGDTPSRRE